MLRVGLSHDPLRFYLSFNDVSADKLLFAFQREGCFGRAAAPSGFKNALRQIFVPGLGPFRS